MAVRTTCSSCGIVILLDSPDCGDIVAKGDRFYHQGCIDVHTERYCTGVPAYHIPRDW